MISYIGYKVIHLAGVFILLISLGGLIVNRAVSGNGENSWKKHLTILNGISLVLILIAGFGLLARLGVSWPWPGWIYAKVAIWLAFGAGTVLVKKFAGAGKALLWAFLILAMCAAYMAVGKPF